MAAHWDFSAQHVQTPSGNRVRILVFVRRKRNVEPYDARIVVIGPTSGLLLPTVGDIESVGVLGAEPGKIGYAGMPLQPRALAIDVGLPVVVA